MPVGNVQLAAMGNTLQNTVRYPNPMFINVIMSQETIFNHKNPDNFISLPVVHPWCVSFARPNIRMIDPSQDSRAYSFPLASY